MLSKIRSPIMLFAIASLMITAIPSSRAEGMCEYIFRGLIPSGRSGTGPLSSTSPSFIEGSGGSSKKAVGYYFRHTTSNEGYNDKRTWGSASWTVTPANSINGISLPSTYYRGFGAIWLHGGKRDSFSSPLRYNAYYPTWTTYEEKIFFGIEYQGPETMSVPTPITGCPNPLQFRVSANATGNLRMNNTDGWWSPDLTSTINFSTIVFFGLKSIPVTIRAIPSQLQCGRLSGTNPRLCNASFNVVKSDGGQLPPGTLRINVASPSLQGPTIAIMGDTAGYLELTHQGQPVKLDGSPLSKAITMSPQFVPRITPTGRGNGPESLSINVTFTAD